MEKKMNAPQNTIIAVSSQKGGVGKTTTAVNLAHALALKGSKTLLVDCDPQGNASQALGFKIHNHGASIADLLWDKTIPTERAIYRRPDLDVIVANPTLSRTELGMSTLINAELRLAQRLKPLKNSYDVIIIDSAPSYGRLLNSVLNAAEHLVIPVDCNYFSLMGVQELHGVIEEIREGTNASLNVLGYVMTMVDRTIIATQTSEAVKASFGSEAGGLFATQIRRAVALREAPMIGKTIFEYDPKSPSAEEHRRLSVEVLDRLLPQHQRSSLRLVGSPALSAYRGV